METYTDLQDFFLCEYSEPDNRKLHVVIKVLGEFFRIFCTI